MYWLNHKVIIHLKNCNSYMLWASHLNTILAVLTKYVVDEQT